MEGSQGQRNSAFGRLLHADLLQTCHLANPARVAKQLGQVDPERRDAGVSFQVPKRDLFDA
jgi:hypothetical protein